MKCIALLLAGLAQAQPVGEYAPSEGMPLPILHRRPVLVVGTRESESFRFSLPRQ